MRTTFLLVSVVVAMVFASVALGAGNSSTRSVYRPKATAIQKSVPPKSQNSPTKVTLKSKPSSGTLPFTGLDLGLFAVAGIGLGAIGLGLRRVSRKPEPSDRG